MIKSKYDSIIWTQSLIIQYETINPGRQKVLDKILNYTNTEMKEAIARRKPLGYHRWAA
ncbi:hypothetical protein ACNKHU_10495 [Shigella flexneri]